MLDSQRMIEVANRADRRLGMHENLERPRNENDGKNKSVVSLHAARDRFKFADLEGWQNQILTDQTPPFAIEDF